MTVYADDSPNRNKDLITEPFSLARRGVLWARNDFHWLQGCLRPPRLQPHRPGIRYCSVSMVSNNAG
jgi:hypothetical protein